MFPALLWFGGYYSWVFYEEGLIAEFSAATSAKNVGKTIRFDPNEQSLVFARGYGAIRYVQRYDLEEAFEFNGVGGENRYRVIRVTDRAICDKFRRDKIAVAAGVHVMTDIQDRSSENNGEQLCIISMDEPPSKRQIRTYLTSFEDVLENIPVIKTTTTVKTVDGKEVILSGASVARLSKFPLPVVGCIPTDKYIEDWNCSVSFIRTNHGPAIKENDWEYILATSLGLQAVSVRKHKLYNQQDIERLIAETIESATQAELQILDSILSDPLVKVGNDPFLILPYRKDLMDERQRKIVTTIDYLADLNDKGKKNKLLLDSLLERGKFIEREKDKRRSAINYH
ncbi:hypothetical protein GCM10009096_21040 [Parasphingorhabdus litoris]|uniref:Uncharacterized protein n=2 Tax=Parasphingorhabdus litoris TaxID=394733 RepID=A0ABP3KFS4_9SPHN